MPPAFSDHFIAESLNAAATLLTDRMSLAGN
jgi:hypothetical protein